MHAIIAPLIVLAMLLPFMALAVLLPGVQFAVSAAVETFIGADKPLRAQLARVLMMQEKDCAGLAIPALNGTVKHLGTSRAKKIIETLG